MIEDKITTREALSTRCKAFHSDKKRIGFTSGAFDILHAGHVDYLEKAKALCDVLIVGVNSDMSVRKYKGENRPIIGEAYRVKVVAALEAVDYVFLFNERRNQKNIEALMPDVYIKAGDYKKEELTSSKFVEQNGGEVRLIPVQNQISTSSILEKIAGQSQGLQEGWIERENAVHLDLRDAKQRPAVFLDRDGTINEDVGYLHDPDKLRFLPHALEGIKKMHDMDYRIVIVTNQPGIGIGYFPEEDFYKVNRAMLSAFSKVGILVSKIYFCPHSKSEQCTCRKPGQALIQRAIKELNLDVEHSWFIGDKTSDVETGRRAGMHTILVKTGFRGEDGEFKIQADADLCTLTEAADYILNKERK